MNISVENFSLNQLSSLTKKELKIFSQIKFNAAFFIKTLLKKSKPNEDLSPSIIFKFCKDVDQEISLDVICETMKHVNNFRCDMEFNIITSLGKKHPLFNDKEAILYFIENTKNVETKLLRKTLEQCFEVWNNKKMFFIYEHPNFVLKWLKLKDYPLKKIPSIVISNDELFYLIVKEYYPQLNEQQVQQEHNFLKKVFLNK